MNDRTYNNSTNTTEDYKNMNKLKKEFIKIQQSDIENVKSLFQAYGVTYIEALGEADKLCAKLVCKNRVFACLSEDMDLFVYGCNRVFRYLSLLNKTVICYDLKKILTDVNLTLEEFKCICIASGTDYNTDNDTNLFQTLKYFKKYKKSNENNFYEWLEDNTNYVKNIYELYNVINLFSLSNMQEYKMFDKIKIMNGPINKIQLIKIMEFENFIFME